MAKRLRVKRWVRETSLGERSPAAAGRAALLTAPESLPDLPSDHPANRLYLSTAALVSNDLGGVEHLTHMQTLLVRRVSGFEVLIDQIEQRAREGERVDLPNYAAAARAQAYILKHLGLKRRPRQVEEIPLASTYLDAGAENSLTDAFAEGSG